MTTCFAVPMAAKKKVSDESSAAFRVSAMRKLLGLTQEQLADAGGLTRPEVVKIEGGQNQATTDRIRGGLALAFGLTRDDLSDFLDGAIDLDEATARRTRNRLAGRPSANGTKARTERYPSRPAALAALRARGVDQKLIDVVASMNAHSEEDPGPDYWVTEALRDARRLVAKVDAPATDDDAFTTPKVKGRR